MRNFSEMIADIIVLELLRKDWIQDIYIYTSLITLLAVTVPPVVG